MFIIAPSCDVRVSFRAERVQRRDREEMTS